MAGAKVLPERIPRTSWQGDKAEDCPPRFSFEVLDRAYSGDWGWELCDDADKAKLFTFLHEVGKMKWSEIRRWTAGSSKKRWPKYHSQPFASVCQDAQRRLGELKHDEQFETLVRFRVDQKKRLWGYEVDGVFYLLWWDPEHKVYPTEPH